jgi:hypothetical protein
MGARKHKKTRVGVIVNSENNFFKFRRENGGGENRATFLFGFGSFFSVSFERAPQDKIDWKKRRLHLLQSIDYSFN